MEDLKIKRKRAAAASQRYRHKKHDALPTRHHRTQAEQQALLNAPYADLSENEKALVRYYRSRARTIARPTTPPSTRLETLAEVAQKTSSSIENPSDKVTKSAVCFYKYVCMYVCMCMYVMDVFCICIVGKHSTCVFTYSA